jgi:hypothetical protein
VSADATSSDRVRAVLQAELALLRAREQLSRAEEDALRHDGYGSAAYDDAIATYREACAWATIVRAVCRCRNAEQGQGLEPG